jgi:hypothetical protein
MTKGYKMSDYEKFVGKKVVLTRNLKEADAEGNLAVELEGTLEAANAVGVMFKAKGQVKPEIFELGEIEEVRYAPEKAKKQRAKKLKPVEYGQAKSHLLERHGLTLTQVNGWTEEQALAYHNEIDHVKADLGHVHEDKSEAEAAEAVAAESEED